ncbi:hypothetical protein [Nesterenkonia populi]
MNEGDVREELSAQTQVIVQDASPIVGEEPSYAPDGGAAWTIVQACSDQATLGGSDLVEYAVVPSDEYDEQLQDEVEAGDHGDLISGC